MISRPKGKNDTGDFEEDDSDAPPGHNLMGDCKIHFYGMKD